jgi:hypothetical protein
LKRTPAKELKVVLAGSTVNEVKDDMPSKAKAPIEFTPLGNVKFVIAVFRKALPPIDCTVSGIETALSDDAL